VSWVGRWRHLAAVLVSPDPVHPHHADLRMRVRTATSASQPLHNRRTLLAFGFVFNRRTLCLLFSLLQQLKFFSHTLRSSVHVHCEYLKSKQNYQWPVLPEVPGQSGTNSAPAFVKKCDIFEEIWAYYRRTTFSSYLWNKKLILFVCGELFKNLEISKRCPSFPTECEFIWQIFGQARVTENHITIPAFFHFFKSTVGVRPCEVWWRVGLLYCISNLVDLARTIG